MRCQAARRGVDQWRGANLVRKRIQNACAGCTPQRERVTEYAEGRRFVNEARRPGVVFRSENVLEPLENGGSRLTESAALSGPGARLVGVLFGWMIARSVRRICNDVVAAAETRSAERGSN